MDLAEAAGGGAQEQGVREFPDLLESIWTSPKPVVAVVRGPARAGGVGLLAACDVVVAAESATFAFSEVRLGLVPAVISAVVLPRMVPHVAHRLMLTGNVFDAATAETGGLVDLVVPDADVDGELRAQLVELTAGAPAALAETKRLLRAGTTLRFDDLLELSARFFASEEGQEGIASFREKRPARWVPRPTDAALHPGSPDWVAHPPWPPICWTSTAGRATGRRRRSPGRRTSMRRHRATAGPCANLLDHMLDTQRYFAGAARGEKGSPPSPDSAVPVLGRPDGRLREVPGGRSSPPSARTASSRRPARRWASRSATSCCTAGTWRARRTRTRRCPRGSPEAAYECIHGRFTDEQRKGVFKPEIPVGDDATPQQRLLAYTGREPG